MFRPVVWHTFYANASDIQLPASLRGLVTGVIGLDNAARPVSHLVAPARSAAALARQRALAGARRRAPKGRRRRGDALRRRPSPRAGYTGPDLAQAYDYNGMYSRGFHGEGISAALVEFDDFHDYNVRGMESLLQSHTRR